MTWQDLTMEVCEVTLLSTRVICPIRLEKVGFATTDKFRVNTFAKFQINQKAKTT